MKNYSEKKLKVEFDALRQRLKEIKALADDGRHARVAHALADFGFFCRTYFPHLCEGGCGNTFHDWMFWLANQLEAGSRHCIAAPRGHAKTTYLARLYPLWRLLRADTYFAVIIQDATEQAESTIECIKIELEDNQRLAADFPDAVGPGRVWRQGDIVTAKGVRLKAYGSGKRIRGANYRGKRPDLIIIDDLENDESVKSKIQREKLHRWLEKAVLLLGPPDDSHQVLFIGTILHSDSVLLRISKRPDFVYTRFQALIQFPDRMDLWEAWERLYHVDTLAALDFYQRQKADMDQAAQVLWPEVKPLYKLFEIRAASRESFANELQNEPLDPEAQTFKPESLRFWSTLPPLVCTVGALDPALGKATGDYTAIVILGRDKDGLAYVLEADLAKYTPMQAIERIISYQKQYQCCRWAIESIAFQALVKDLLVQTSIKVGVPVPAVGVKPKYAKEVRIQSLAPHVANGVIRFNSRHRLLLDQLYEWPLSAHDDGPDALDMAFALIHSAAPIEFMAAGHNSGEDNRHGGGLKAGLKRLFTGGRGF